MNIERENVLFVIAPHKGHYNCVLPLAHTMNNFYNVVFIGPSNFEDLIVRQGFAYRLFYFSQFQTPLSISLLGGRILRKENSFQVECNEFEFILNKIKPKIIFLDVFLTIYYPIIKNHQARVIQIQTMLPTNKVKNIPPLNSKFKPFPSIFSNIYCELSWNLLMIRKRIVLELVRIASLYNHNFDKIKKLKGFNKKDFNFVSCFSPLLANVPEILLSPKELDFPWRSTLKTQIYYGLSIHLNRPEYVADNLIVTLEKIRQQNSKLIFCSFGTVLDSSQEVIQSFISNIFTIAQRNPSWYFLITGNTSHIQHSQLKNFEIIRNPPQLTILQKAEMMISHGGLNTIQECILFEVPILLYPIGKSSDRFGNMSRVLHNGIGLSGNIRKDDSNKIEKRINQILNSKDIIDNIKTLKNRIEKSNYSQQFNTWMNDFMVSNIN